jgi:Kdo2-lipid IVA lauroyltransferase/acyltransferase
MRLMFSLFKIFSALPLWMAHPLGWLLGWASFALSGRYRHQFHANASQAGVSRLARWRAVGAAGQQISELPRLWFGPAQPVHWDGASHIDAALASGRGMVFLTPHLGCFEVTAQAYAQRYGQGRGEASRPMTVLYRPPRKAWLIHLVTRARQRPGLRTAPTSLAGVKQLIKALKSGECVGLLPDQVPPAGQGVWSPFFGRNAYTMTLAVRLAQQTNATILLAWGERLKGGKGYLVHVAPLPPHSATSPMAPDLEGAVRQINAAMENLIRACPAQYLWGYARYKQPRFEA